MKNRLLLPHQFKLPGWLILIPSSVFGLFLASGDYETDWLKTRVFAVMSDEIFSDYRPFLVIETDLTNTLAGSLFLLGALMVGFSRERHEDEFIAGLRLSSLLWAVWLNSAILLFCFLFIYGTAFFTVMIYNMFTVLLIFIVRFNYLLYRNSKAARHEE